MNRIIENCDICGNAGRRRFLLDGYAVRKCSACRFQWVETFYDEQDYIKTDYYWAKGFYIENEDIMRRVARNDVKEIIKIFDTLGLKEKRWLDFGCGMAYLISEAKKNGFEVMGVEAKKEIVEYVRTRENLNIVNALISKFKPPTEKFTVVTFFDVLEHLIKPKDALLRAGEILEKGGLIAIEVPDDDSLFRLLARWQYIATFGRWKSLLKQSFHSHPGGHRNGFTKHALVKLLRELGFEVIRTSKTMIPFDLFLNETLRKEKGLRRFVYLIIASAIYIISIVSGMQNRIKIYARKK